MNPLTSLLAKCLIAMFALTWPTFGVSASSPVSPHFYWLKLGEVKPEGWIKAQMERDLRQGFAGKLTQLAPEVTSDIFGSGRNKPGRPNVSRGGGPENAWWNGESEGNYWTGYIMMAYLTGDAAAKQKADAYVNHILQTQDPDGYIGVYSPQLRYSMSPMNGELWTQTCILRGLLAYYELTGQSRVLKAVERAVHLTMTKYGPGRLTAFGIPGAKDGVAHGLMFEDVLECLYDLTGNAAYRDFGIWLYQDFCTHIPNSSRYADATVASLLNLEKPFMGHGAHVYEHIRVPLWIYYLTGNPIFKKAYENAFIKINRYILPGGAAVSMEDIKARVPDPTRTYYEYCAMKELVATFSSGLQKTGRAELGDRIETLMFNAAEGARSYAGKGITYCTRDNRYRVDGALGGRDKFSPTHSDIAVCCVPNAVQIMPLYVRAMWMRTHEGGLAANLYGPSAVSIKVDGVGVRVDEKTEYPFSSVISIAVSPQKPVSFSLFFRNPDWSKGTRLECERAAISRKGNYFVVRKTWKKGDVVTVQFTEPIVARTAANGQLYLQRGPLVYSLRIPAIEHDIKHYKVPGFADKLYDPAKGACWSYALDPSRRNGHFGFTVNQDKAASRLYPYDGSPLQLQGKLINLRTGKLEEVSLIPMGSSLAILRRVTFPVGRRPKKQLNQLRGSNFRRN